jgi:hypothetical protein
VAEHGPNVVALDVLEGAQVGRGGVCSGRVSPQCGRRTSRRRRLGAARQVEHLGGGGGRRLAVAAGELVGEVLDTLRMLSDEGMTMILVTHEIRFARDVSDRVAFFRDGVIHEIGSPQQVIDNPQRPETAAFLKSSH